METEQRVKMGMGYRYHCNQCGMNYKVSTGVGMTFPQVYQQIVADVLAGKCGQEWKDVAQNIQHFAVDAELRLYRCDHCGFWDVGYDLSLYAPKSLDKLLKKQYGEKTVAEWGYAPYVMDSDLAEDYDLIKERLHPCKKCGKPMTVVNAESDEAPDLKCLECGASLVCSDCKLFWD